jgi:hypothetical protein
VFALRVSRASRDGTALDPDDGMTARNVAEVFVEGISGWPRA